MQRRRTPTANLMFSLLEIKVAKRFKIDVKSTEMLMDFIVLYLVKILFSKMVIFHAIKNPPNAAATTNADS